MAVWLVMGSFWQQMVGVRGIGFGGSVQVQSPAFQRDQGQRWGLAVVLTELGRALAFGQRRR